MEAERFLKMMDMLDSERERAKRFPYGDPWGALRLFAILNPDVEIVGEMVLMSVEKAEATLWL